MDLFTSNQPATSESNINGRLTAGKENMIGRAIFKGSEMLCPVSTSSALAIAEQPELRAYKLGKQKCSYNQVELVIKDMGAGKMAELKVSEAIETTVGDEVDQQLRESCLKFNVRFVNNNRIHLYIYVVYATPYGTSKADKHSLMYHWIPVTRLKCRKGCKGPVIRGLQRFGRMPRRSASALDGEDSWKEPRHLYIAIDEASTHVCPRHETSKFRLLVAAYDDKNQLLGTTVSSSIRVLANNDAPLGAASFKLHCHIQGTTESLLRNTNNISIERLALGRAPLKDILQNSSPPRSYQSTTTDETAKQVDGASNIGPLLALEQNQITSGKGVEQAISGAAGTRIRRTGAETAVTSPEVEKEHSLTDLCQKLFKACVAKQEHGQATITLRGLANSLGARRRRILEILNVLESIQVVQHQGKERYTWIGSTQLRRALFKLKGNIFTGTVREQADTTFGRSFLSPIRRAKLKTPVSSQMEGLEVSNPMRSLSKQFIQLFLVHERSYLLSWEQILECIVDGQGHDPETTRAKTRRLGEIARIFSALQLIKKTWIHEQKLLAYEWLGTEGVIEHLVSLNNAGPGVTTKKVDGRNRKVHYGMVKPPTNKEMLGTVAGQQVYDQGSRLDDANQHSQLSKETSIPSNDSQTNLVGETSAPRRNWKRKLTDIDENEPCSGDFILSQPKYGYRFHYQTNQSAIPESSSNDFLASCGAYALRAAYRLCQTTLAGHIRGEISSQLDASIAHQISLLPNWRTHGGAHGNTPCLRQGNHQYRSSGPHDRDIDQQEAHLQEVPSYAAVELDRGSCHVTILDSPSSWGRAGEGFTSPDKTDDGSSTTEQCLEDKVTSQVQQVQGVTLDADSAPILDGCTKWHHLARLTAEPPSNSEAAAYCESLPAALAGEDTFQPIKRPVELHTQVPGIACSAAHQFPYKKRKFDTSFFTSFMEPKECNQSRLRASSPRRHNQPQLTQEPEEGRASTFDPLFHLLCFNSPKRIFQLQAQDPAFLFNYVKESRALYHRWCGQRAVVQNVIRPLAKVKAAVPPSICGHWHLPQTASR